MVVIVKNSTDQPKMIEDLGIEIPINTQINLSELFSFFEIMSSNDLKYYIDDETLIINNGISDLNNIDGLEYITFRYE